MRCQWNAECPRAVPAWRGLDAFEADFGGRPRCVSPTSRHGRAALVEVELSSRSLRHFSSDRKLAVNLGALPSSFAMGRSTLLPDEPSAEKASWAPGRLCVLSKLHVLFALSLPRERVPSAGHRCRRLLELRVDLGRHAMSLASPQRVRRAPVSGAAPLLAVLSGRGSRSAARGPQLRRRRSDPGARGLHAAGAPARGAGAGRRYLFRLARGRHPRRGAY